jgi:DNA-binding CsgD family transcriptional regulator
MAPRVASVSTDSDLSPALDAASRRDVLHYVERAVRQHAGAVIVGEAGIGKSHVARAVAARLRTRGARVEHVLATEAASTVPFGALAGLLEPASEASGDLLDVLRTAGARLARLARGAPLAVVVDDAHRLDPASAALLLQLVTRHGIRVLATVRAGVPVPDAVTSLWKDAALLRVDLQPLTEDAAADVARELLGGPVEQATRRWLCDTSAGNPLYLRELVRAGLDSSSLVQQQGHWLRVKPIAPPRRLLDLLDQRLDSLTEGERRALGLVVLAEPVSFELLARLGALDAAHALESRGLLAATQTLDGTRLRVGHPLYGEALRASLKATEARALHAELAAQLDPGGDGHRLRLAAWAVDDGQVDDTALLLAAAEDALAAFDPQLAIRLASAAMAGAPGIHAALPLAVALRTVGRFAEAEHYLAVVEGEARRSARVTAYLFVRATNLQWSLGRGQQARALLARIDVKPSSTVVTAALLSSEGRLGDGIAMAQEVLANPGTDRLAQSIAGVLVGHDLAVTGNPVAALEVLDRVQRSAKGVESEWPRAAVAAAAAFYAAEQWPARIETLRRRHAQARAAGDDARASLCELALGRLAVPSGDLDDARRYAEDAIARLAFADPRAMAPAAYALIAETHATAGRVAAARDALTRSHEILERAPVHPVVEHGLHLATAAVLAAEGDQAEAQAGALEAATKTGEAILNEAELLHLFLRVGGAADRVATRLQEIAAATGAGMAELYARQATAARDGDGIELLEAASAFEEIGARIFAAEAAAQAAVALATGTSVDAQRRAEAYAARLVRACGADGLTAVSSMHLSALTAREQEAARLVARGLTNAQIAARMSLSVRTVESYIYRATTKLGVNDRSALAGLLARPRS